MYDSSSRAFFDHPRVYIASKRLTPGLTRDSAQIVSEAILCIPRLWKPRDISALIPFAPGALGLRTFVMSGGAPVRQERNNMKTGHSTLSRLKGHRLHYEQAQV